MSRNERIFVIRLSRSPPEEYSINSDEPLVPQFDQFYGPLRNYVRMVSRGYHKYPVPR